MSEHAPQTPPAPEKHSAPIPESAGIAARGVHHIRQMGVRAAASKTGLRVRAKANELAEKAAERWDSGETDAVEIPSPTSEPEVSDGAVQPARGRVREVMDKAAEQVKQQAGPRTAKLREHVSPKLAGTKERIRPSVNKAKGHAKSGITNVRKSAKKASDSAVEYFSDEEYGKRRKATAAGVVAVAAVATAYGAYRLHSKREAARGRAEEEARGRAEEEARREASRHVKPEERTYRFVENAATKQKEAFSTKVYNHDGQEISFDTPEGRRADRRIRIVTDQGEFLIYDDKVFKVGEVDGDGKPKGRPINHNTKEKLNKKWAKRLEMKDKDGNPIPVGASEKLDYKLGLANSRVLDAARLGDDYAIDGTSIGKVSGVEFLTSKLPEHDPIFRNKNYELINGEKGTIPARKPNVPAGGKDRFRELEDGPFKGYVPEFLKRSEPLELEDLETKDGDDGHAKHTKRVKHAGKK
ncbi:MAG TPA: hypothetical protein VLG27_01175 [Candidatus Saccharimonadia bacterium]|nr:hypothetical protein [Candidatus Saccharimonadia bacterium]